MELYLTIRKCKIRKQIKHNRKLLLLKAPSRKPYNKSPEYKILSGKIESINYDICFVALPFGVIPLHLSETYPLSQYDIVEPTDEKTLSFSVDKVIDFLKNQRYEKILFYTGKNEEDIRIIKKLKKNFSSPELTIYSVVEPWSPNSINKLIKPENTM